MLDLGCGINSDLAEFRTIEREVWGADFQAHPDLQHREWFRQLQGDGSIPFPSEHFDAIVTVMVLEHVVDPNRFLAEVSRVLRPGGRFIAHSISGNHYVTFLRRLFGLLPHSINQAIVKALYNRQEADTFPAYYRMNTRRRLQRINTRTGLKLLSMQRYADPGYFRFAKPIELVAIIADRLLEEFCPGWGRLYFTMIAEKPLCGAEQSHAA
jgi:ubiquinone/menaquinone biosynthesis C-methylase UbiE